MNTVFFVDGFNNTMEVGKMSNLSKFLGCFLIIVVGFMIASYSHAEPSRIVITEEPQKKSIEGAKALFGDNDGATFLAPGKKVSSVKAKQSKQEKYVGFAYWIELLKPDGNLMLTDIGRVFETGDKIKLKIESNYEGFLYIINKGSTGAYRVLFPPPNVDNFIEKKKVCSVPYNTYMKFDNNPGEEVLMVYLSPRKILDIENPRLIASVNGSKDIIIEDANLQGTKDIVLDGLQHAVDYRTASSVSGVIVAPLSSIEKQNDVISLQIKLKHN